ncbi:hypothetical protein [Rhizobium sp. LjRoot254]|uniref:hypothetical protein n=1 Tax=Rhizobium sp. LjRoot254 TaxID=3342297 RepID=UPI003ECC34A0
MQKISLAWYARLSANLRPLLVGGLDTVELALTTLQAAWPYLAYLGDPKGPLSLDATRPVIWNIMRLGEELLRSPEDQRAEILDKNRQSIYQLTANLNILLDADLGHQPVYHVYPKRAYSIDKLIEDAASLFSSEVTAEFSDSEIFDIREAGKCLAFEVPTAAAFHLFRAVDALLQRYTIAVAGSLPKSKNWGQYLAELDKCGVDPKITSVLRQLKDLHRNPIIHPEVRLTLEEGLSLIGIAESAVSLVVRDLIARRP